MDGGQLRSGYCPLSPFSSWPSTVRKSGLENGCRKVTEGREAGCTHVGVPHIVLGFCGLITSSGAELVKTKSSVHRESVTFNNESTTIFFFCVNF